MLKPIRVVALMASAVFTFMATLSTSHLVSADDLNGSARNALTVVLVVAVLGYAIAVGQYVALRARPGTDVPVIGMALFGSFLCLLVFGV